MTVRSKGSSVYDSIGIGRSGWKSLRNRGGGLSSKSHRVIDIKLFTRDVRARLRARYFIRYIFVSSRTVRITNANNSKVAGSVILGCQNILVIRSR